METINFSIPVNVFNYRQSENSLYSYAKLKIFYVGETEDKRLFTKEFSDNLLKSLPYVPVVGYYNEEDEDFEGHNNLQYIYGVVPENNTIEYITEDGKEYAVCDIILYTGRKDETGKIAQKIVGKQHSLELNPENTKYLINKDENGSVINVEFVEGTLIGLSVLGDNQKPAFEGSGFFTRSLEMKEIFEGFKEEIAKFNKVEKTFNALDVAINFIKLSISEKVELLYSLLYPIFGEYMFIEQVFDDYLVVSYFDERDGFQYSKVPYSIGEDEKIKLGISEKVLPRYLTKEEIENIENMSLRIATLERDGVNEEGQNQETKNTEETNKGDFSTTALNNSEREELNSFRRERKINLINSFSDDLPKEFLNKLIEKIDECSFEELEVTLSKEFTKITKENSSIQKGKGLNTLMYTEPRQSVDSLKELIDRYK